MIQKQIADELRSIVGKEWFLDSPEDLASYSYDGFLPEFTPDAVIIPADADEISGILTLANRERINIIPRGAGTNICGSSVAREGGVIIGCRGASDHFVIRPAVSPKRNLQPNLNPASFKYSRTLS